MMWTRVERSERRQPPERLGRMFWRSGAPLLAGLVVVAALAQSRPVRATAQAATVAETTAPALAVDRGGPVFVRRGYDESEPFETVAYDHGTRVVVAYEIERIVIRLEGDADAWRQWRYAGYSVVNLGLRPLPIGATLDAARGIFYWQPGPAFIGTYDLLFVRIATDGQIEQVAVQVVLIPRYSGESDVQLAIDIPARGDVTQPFVVAGWALDRGSAMGTGIATLHVWAYPVTPAGYGAPFFLGVARYGDERPDVGAYFGQRFTPSAYGLVVTGMPPGTFDVAIFPYSTVSGKFEAARLVRVTVR